MKLLQKSHRTILRCVVISHSNKLANSLQYIKNNNNFGTYRFCTNQQSNSCQKFVIPSRIGGHSQEKLYQFYKQAKYYNRPLQAVKNQIKGATILTTRDQCKKCVQKLMKVDSDTVVAWDTQTFDLDIKQQSPIGHGKIICASFFAGPEYNFGNGSRVFIDNFGANAGLIDIFKEYLESQKHKKVWHNYGFDRHIFHNHGIDCRGFGGDTMHMARLYDSSRLPGQYSLASLTKSYQKQIKNIIQSQLDKKLNYYQKMFDSYNQNSQANQQKGKDTQQKLSCLGQYLEIFRKRNFITKRSMEDLFYQKKVLKSGKQGKVLEFPSILTLHTSPKFIKKWIQYSLLDTQSTFFLRLYLQSQLKKQKGIFKGFENMWVLYQKQWLPFGECLTSMERKGFKIDVGHMQTIKAKAKQDLITLQKQFKAFVAQIQDDPNIHLFNPASPQQMQQLLHAPFKVKQNKQGNRESEYETAQDFQLKENADDIQPLGRKKPVRKEILQLKSQQIFMIDNPSPKPGNGMAKLPMKIKGLGIQPVKLTPNQLPSVDVESLKQLAGNPKQAKYGKAYYHFLKMGQQKFGIKICEAIQKLLEYRNIETLYNTFIDPLYGYIDPTERIHCSLNINTETGRLSSRKPNLQNQPALQKDIYKIRKAFVAENGKKLIVADYGQLQLRVLAHISNCKGMIQAFKQGGDFHSRTAIGMYDYIKKDLQNQTVLLQWDKSKGKAPAPLIKDKYAAQRRKAKTVNFSIAYGKTAMGFANDWNCTVKQANQVIKAWFNDRKQVKDWQDIMKKVAAQKRITRTLLGRIRKLDRFRQRNPGMMNRRAVNTPIQGGAADIVIAAMVRIHKNEQLKRLGWELQLQIHDELILQGPQQSANQALQIVRDCMSHPFQQDLRVELQIDAKIGNSWYQCK